MVIKPFWASPESRVWKAGGGFQIGLEQVGDIGKAPMAREEQQYAGEQGSGDVGEQADCLSLDQELNILHAHQEDSHQNDDADDHGMPEGEPQTKGAADKGDNRHDNSGEISL